MDETAPAGARGRPAAPAPEPAPIDDPAGIRRDERWIRERELFERLYSYPRAVPFIHEPCPERTNAARYLCRTDTGEVRCPCCGARVTPDLARCLGIEKPRS